jgi:DnaK suppressor protein
MAPEGTLRGGTLLDKGQASTRTKAGMDKKRLEYYKKKLVTRREELTKTIARTQEEGRTADDDATVDLADKAANSYTKEFLFGMTNTDRTILNMIDAALKRIQEEEYGVCANCPAELQQKRLEAVPWAKHCLACQEKMEQGLLQ